MKLLFPTTQTRPYYEKNALNKALGWSANPISPHSATVRATYICPANRRAVITSVNLYYMRMTAPTTPGVVWLAAYLLTGATSGYIAQLSNEKINVFGTEILNFPCEIWLTSGDELNLYSSDISVGGSGFFRLFITYTEFDL